MNRVERATRLGGPIAGFWMATISLGRLVIMAIVSVIGVFNVLGALASGTFEDDHFFITLILVCVSFGVYNVLNERKK
jgi:hypothetical protein